MVARMCMQSPWICCLAGMSQTCECMRRHVMVQVAGAFTHQHGHCLEAELEGRRNLRGPGVHRVTEGAWLRMPFQNGGECLFKPCHASCGADCWCCGAKLVRDLAQLVVVVVQEALSVWTVVHHVLGMWCNSPCCSGSTAPQAGMQQPMWCPSACCRVQFE
mgnify:CR=1 FL=1